jgi:LysR family transcriptional regulator, glycine cleavage system transcriptional activator
MTRRLPQLNALRAFEAAARLGSFAAAAAELHVTPGAVSQQVRGLEDWLGLRLFERRPQALQLTAAGRGYLPSLSEAFDRIDAATRELLHPPTRRSLTLAMPAAFAAGWLLPRLDRFHGPHPDIEIRLNSTTRRIEPDTEGVDAVIRQGRGGFGNLACWHLFGEQLVPVCGAKAAQRRLEALDAADDWGDWRAAHPTVQLNDEGRLTFGDSRLAIEAAVNGLGIAIVDLALIEPLLAEGRLVMPFAVPPWRRGTGWYLVHAARRQQEPAMAALFDWLMVETDGSMP